MRDLFQSIFSNGKVNTGRQIELDWFKAFAIMGMVLCHVEETIFSFVWEDRAFCPESNIMLFLSLVGLSCAAFGFMFSMGTTIVFSRNNSPDDLIKRGIRLILIWILLKILYIVPLSIRFASPMGLTKVFFIYKYIFCNDIFCFAGLFFLYYGFLQKKCPFKIILIISTFVFSFGQFIELDFHGKYPILEALLGEFVITGVTSFPFVCWLPAPILGICWGKALMHCKNKDRLYACAGITGLLGLSLIMLILRQKGLLNITGLRSLNNAWIYYCGNYKTVFCALTIFILVLCFFYTLSKFLKYKWVHNSVSFISANISVIYIIQWIIIPILAAVFPIPEAPVSAFVSMGIAAVVFFFSLACAFLLSYFKKIQKGQKP